MCLCRKVAGSPSELGHGTDLGKTAGRTSVTFHVNNKKRKFLYYSCLRAVGVCEFLQGERGAPRRAGWGSEGNGAELSFAI